MRYRFLILFLLFSVLSLWGQEKWRIVSYNVENLFDTKDDTLVNDNEFTPKGRMHWTEKKYADKLLKLSRSIQETGNGNFPVFIGLCEIENRRVLQDLTAKTVLADADYGIVHEDSPDPRGIDVALLYRKDIYKPLSEKFLPVTSGRKLRSRDILYSSGVIADKDTIHIFVCHFPSMSGGEKASEWKREFAAAIVKRYVDSIQELNPEAAIVIMGDLNGKADKSAQSRILGVKNLKSGKPLSKSLYNTGYYLLSKNYGSYKYRGNWQTIDHIIVSGSMLNKKNPIQVEKRMKVFNEDFLLEQDKKYYGFKPLRTNNGPRYNGGYSDHLPVYLEFNY
jgi:predicted extracellular nuclease